MLGALILWFVGFLFVVFLAGLGLVWYCRWSALRSSTSNDDPPPQPRTTALRNQSRQFSLRTLLIVSAALPVIAGVFYGTFGERARESALWVLVQCARLLLPMACTAWMVLLAMVVWSLVKRHRND